MTKTAAIVSAVVITVLQIGAHPDMTPALQALATLAVVGGWLAAGSRSEWAHVGWVSIGILAPAILRAATGREGPALDIFWMSGLTAALLRTSTWSGWSLSVGAGFSPPREGPPEGGHYVDDSSRRLAGAWALTLSLSWPILAAREAGFNPRLLFDLGAINSWSQWSAPHAITWIAFVAWSQLIGLLWLDRVAGRMLQDTEAPRRALHGFWAATTVASLVAMYQSVFDLTFLNTEFWAVRERASGTLLDANAFGICAALAGPSALLAFRGSRWKQAGTSIALIMAINLTGMWMSGSRTALVCAVVTTAGVVVALRGAANQAKRRVMMVAAAGALVTVAVFVLAGGTVGPIKRLFERSADASGSSFVDTIVNRRPYGPTAVDMLRDYPFTGVGLGSYQQLAPDYWRRQANDSLPFDNAQNWWRHQAAELGLLGAVPLFAWSALIAWRVLLSRSRKARSVDATVTRAVLLAIGICSLIQVPTQPLVVLLWFLLFVAWLPLLIEKPRSLLISRSLLIALAVAYGGAHLVLARGPLAVVERAKTFDREYIVGAYSPEPMEGGGVFRWTRDQARFIWQPDSPWFVIQVWAHHPDIATSPVRVTITTPCAVLVDRLLSSTAPLSIGVTLPPGQKALDATVQVSRTWQPSAFGGSDSRHLGIGISAESVPTRDIALDTHVQVEPRPCQSAL